MAEWGVTDRGFRRKTYQDIIADMEAKAKDLFGPNIDVLGVASGAVFCGSWHSPCRCSGRWPNECTIRRTSTRRRASP